MILNKTNFMDLKSAINIILRDLKQAGDLIDDLKNKPDLPELQIELARSKCKSAEDLIKILGELIDDAMPHDIKEPEEEKAEQERKKIEQVEEKTEPDRAKTEQIEEKAEPEETEMKVTMVKDDILEIHDEIIEEDTKEKKIVADKFAHLSSRINEKVGDSKKAEGKTRTLPVNDLNRAIGINDRFYFLRELFNGKEETYRQTINSLNNASSKEEATRILQEAVKEMADSEPALQLLELVERKLSGK